MDLKEVFSLLGTVALMALGAMVLMFVFVLPFAYLEGRAKARVIKEVRGLELPWYEATFIDVRMDAVDGRVELSEELVR